jgi:hypothetical protein
MKKEEKDFEQVKQRFPELDEHAHRRARARVAGGVDAHAALAQESVLQQMNRAYQPH